MKKLLLIIFSLTLINCEKDGVGEDDPIRATWLGEFESEDYNGDTAYFQVVYKFNDDLLYTKSKFSRISFKFFAYHFLVTTIPSKPSYYSKRTNLLEN